MKTLKIALGSDHAGFTFKGELAENLNDAGYFVMDCGAHSQEASDYPDFALRVAKAVASGRVDRGILLCGSGTGMAMAANKVAGVRAAVCWSVEIAKLSVEHNWANVLCLPARFISKATSKKIVDVWLKTTPDKDVRHVRRVKKIRKIESKRLV